MKSLVIYNSQYGHTKKYAEWLAEELHADICNSKNLKKIMLDDYSILIFGSSLYAGNCQGARLVVKHFEQIKDKKVVLFTVGMYDTNREKNCMDIMKELNKVITPAIKERIKIFHMRGGIDSQNLSFQHKIMMKFAHVMLSKKSANERTDGDKDFLSIYGTQIDFSDKKMLAPVITFVQELREQH